MDEARLEARGSIIGRGGFGVGEVRGGERGGLVGWRGEQRAAGRKGGGCRGLGRDEKERRGVRSDFFTVDPHNDDHEEYVTSGCVYSSETGTWGELTPMHCEFGMDFGDFSCVLVGRSLVYFMSNGMAILEHNFQRNELALIDTPDTPDYEYRGIYI
jgi:hypothetical protein